ncbi:hypothetical protein EK21DRAFT_95518 [Setomelanomma holmii]|uniref:Uncharacterized protein n=1 Tax=Setomelanomma holmii TaxID=210430 RepID=A0A9P4GW85_9PLEO|nr:hypothetical protein EK21DRAFT_95518 [Setomelanomma holmii]
MSSIGPTSSSTTGKNLSAPRPQTTGLSKSALGARAELTAFVGLTLITVAVLLFARRRSKQRLSDTVTNPHSMTDLLRSGMQSKRSIQELEARSTTSVQELEAAEAILELPSEPSIGDRSSRPITVAK